MPANVAPLAALFNLPTFWIIVWIALLATTVAIVWLLRTKLREIKSWQKCAILSLWVHVLLACLTAAVRIVSVLNDVTQHIGQAAYVRGLLDAQQ